MRGGRRKAREILFRVLFETEISGDDPLEALEESLARYHLTEDGRDYAVRLARLIGARRAQIDGFLERGLVHWEIRRVSVVVRCLLRLACLELLEAADVPAAVILDQAVELAKRYGEDGADAFVNGVLDPIGAVLRPEELGKEERRG